MNLKNFKGKDQALTLLSPAKVNLFFRIHHRRQDQYHQISSLYQAINLSDTISISLAEEDLFHCNLNHLCDLQGNFIWQAVSLFRQKTGWNQKLSIRLQKNIPLQAGLGGGSSNAATTLWALNQLSHYQFEENQLALWAAELGSDMAFFFSQGTAYCQGKGEIIQQITHLPSTHFWLATPQFGLSTTAVYQKCDASKLTHWDSAQALSDTLQGKFILRNDLEPAAFDLKPELRVIKHQLLAMGFTQVSMTGSGTTFICFGSLETLESPGVVFYPVHFLQRKLGYWYQ
ncbi:4-diphosphocytidyl-2-C-methyl-D-erythritol kinase [Candidatus Rhabdochlamydia oedothoracis]|uniref:4-diphosphocytidyl-2-C-methyl-D-erythritol kinase n=1 Tax=Candidatus Rhabdochlamydia oedothoracis TaxID=2720720 RepID=A0ABX8UZR8_9BACT|nr:MULTISPECIES: 4-(cytidine 5'-diphospho)-2-C-methyl-D-erythritol kinase [Rhabdochlamydia]KAG6559083.1 4-diphosphocytidyl-2-C-methyl-D-erythritol kinase [Candidatus Rhabdochlamydia sp. W815]MCL6756668.1 4-(cytidine 5'-diphospho)-2-C-methyl-D-erythritol kinase [Candidatus Rhabdochlamydia oedothoracis]QYF48467.1 4-diphosphocytidyl-2-C-methyl-D-erythritol kinase [Candidatus Rhabdochlamydia oedothoracis]